MKIILTISLLLILNSTLGCKSTANLHDAAMKGDTTAIKQLLETGISIDLKGANGRTALHIAAEIADTNLAAFLIQRGAAINETDSAGFTPLHLAMGKIAMTPDELRQESDSYRPFMTRFLLSHGANRDAVDNAGWTPLHWAAFWNEYSTILFLHDRGVDVNMRTSRPRILESVVEVPGESHKSLESITFPARSTPLDIVATICKDHKEVQRHNGYKSYIRLQQFGAIQNVTTGSPFKNDPSDFFDEIPTRSDAILTGDSTNGTLRTSKATLSISSGDTISTSVRSEIQSVIDFNAPAIHSCYSREFKKSPDLMGLLTVVITINQAGKVTGVSLSQNSIGDAVATCVQNKIRIWTFPKNTAQLITITETFGFKKAFEFQMQYEL